MKESKKAWYKCDPIKNTECRKTTCIHNKNAKFKICDRTSKVECSTNGIPIDETKE